jgi:CRISPR-associated protein Csx10
MKTITYRLTLEEPLLVTALEGDPNSAVSYDYIPGSVLRGVLIGLKLRKEGLDELDAAAEAERRCFFSHETRFLNGYPVLGGKRCLPAPHTWMKKRYGTAAEKSEIKDDAFKDRNQTEDEQNKPKSIRGAFVTFNGDGQVLIADLQRTISVHTLRDRKAGRSRGENNGTIYQYNALAAGQVFEAAILCEHDADAAYLEGLLNENKTVIMGGARSAGYGRVTISAVESPDDWHETGEAPSSSEKIVITLLSDVILRNEHGQHTADLAALCTALGIKPDDVEAYLGQGIVGGFNRKWGLPLPQMPTISMGSVLVLKAGTALSIDERGIGERRNEGFGRLAIGWQRPERAKLSSDKKAPVRAQVEIKLNGAPKELWDEMDKRIKRQKTEREKLEEAHDLTLRVKDLPKSQINRLRQIVLNERLKPEHERKLSAAIAKFLKDISGKRADKHFEKARVNGESMKAWLTKTAEKGEAEKDEAEKGESALILIEAVLERAAKEAGKREENRNE